MESNSRTRLFSCRKFNNNDDSASSIFQIPPEMVRRYGENTLPEEATLRIDNSGKCWIVKIEKFRDLYFFTDGWKEFANDVDIQSRDYLLFNSADQLLSKYSPVDDLDSGEDNGVFYQEEALCVGDEWEFTKELKETDARRIGIPKKFAIGTGITATKRLTLIDAKGEKWPVRVADKNCGDYSMGPGWTDFLIANQAVVGSKMSFKLVSCSKSNVMVKATVVNEGTSEKPLSEFVKRKRQRSENVASRKTSAYEQDSTNFDLKMNCEGKDFGEDRRLSFTEELKPYHVHILKIPKEIASGAGITTASEIKLIDAEGREWPVRVTDKNSSEFSFTAGWYAFLVSNKVVVGSTISFKFTSNDTIEVQVVQMGTDENALFSCVRRNGGKYEVSASHKRDVRLCKKRASLNVDCVSSRLSFSTELRKHNVYRLDIPICFATRSGIDKSREIKLQCDEGRIWTVRVTERNNQFCMSTGWYDFLKENNVVVGSTMSFVLSSGNTVETHILKEGSNKNALFKFMRRRGNRFEFPEPENTGDHHVKVTKVHSMDTVTETSNEDKVSEVEYDLGVGMNWRYSKKLKEEEDDAYKVEFPREFSEVTCDGLCGEMEWQDGKASVMFKSEIQDIWGLYDDYLTE